MMMRVGLCAGLAALIGAAAAAQPAPQAASAASAQAETPAPSCTARKFETIVRFPVADGKIRQSKVKLCGTPGQTDAEWAKTLRDGMEKMKANTAMPAEARQQAVAAIEAELAKVAGSSLPKAPALVAAPPLTAPRTVTPPGTALPEYAALPPFPPPVAPATASVAVAAASTPAVLPSLPRPKLSFSCFSAGDIGDGPCSGFERDTLITVRAGEPLQHTSFRFVRGSVQADSLLPALAKGRSARFALPRAMCAGVGGGSLTIHIVRAPANQPAAGQVVGTEGPYNLRC